jgi:hypothetical protein
VSKPGRSKPRLLNDSHLHVARDLVGRPVASPMRRAVAIGIDWLVLFVPVMAVAIGAAMISLQVQDPVALQSLRSLWTSGDKDPATMHAAWRGLVPLLARIEAPGVPYAALEAAEKGELDAAADLVVDHELQFNLGIGEHEEAALPPRTVSLKVEDLIPKPLRGVAVLGVAALYFTLCHASRRGQTLGKRLVGIRVVQLGGERLSLFESFERSAAYLEIPASLGLSLISLWRDPNRRLPHDRIVHTAVLRQERPAGRPDGLGRAD